MIEEKYKLAAGTPLRFFSNTLQREVDLSVADGLNAVEQLAKSGDRRFILKKVKEDIG